MQCTPEAFRFFCKTYLPHYFPDDSESVFHRWAYTELPEIEKEPESVLQGCAASRGEAKTSLTVQAFALWREVRNAKHNTVIVSDTEDQTHPTGSPTIWRAQTASTPRPTCLATLSSLTGTASKTPPTANGSSLRCLRQPACMRNQIVRLIQNQRTLAGGQLFADHIQTTRRRPGRRQAHLEADFFQQRLFAPCAAQLDIVSACLIRHRHRRRRLAEKDFFAKVSLYFFK